MLRVTQCKYAQAQADLAVLYARKNKAVYQYVRGKILKLTIGKLGMKYKTQFGYSVTV